MTTNQIKNLVNFSFNFHSDSDIDILHISPKYVMEKWNAYIGVNVKEDIYVYYLNDDTLIYKLRLWANTWSNEDESVLKIYSYILAINQKSISNESFNISFLIAEIKKIIDVNKIQSELYNNLHPLINRNIDMWMERKANARYIKLSELL